MKKKNLEAHFKELRLYLNSFPYDYADRVFEIFPELSPGRAKDSMLVRYLDLIEEKKNSKGQLIRDYVIIFEKLFFFLTEDGLKKRYSKVLLDFYLVRFSENEKSYTKKIQKVQEFLGKELTDLPQFKKEESFLNLHLGPKKLFLIISNLISGNKK